MLIPLSQKADDRQKIAQNPHPALGGLAALCQCSHGVGALADRRKDIEIDRRLERGCSLVRIECVKYEFGSGLRVALRCHGIFLPLGNELALSAGAPMRKAPVNET